MRILLIMAQVAGICSALSLIMVGIFSEDYTAEHTFWSAMNFAFMVCFLIFSVSSLRFNPLFIRPIVYYGLMTGVVDFLSGVVFSNVFTAEWVMSGCSLFM